MKTLKPRPRPSAEEALQAVASHAPSLPPVRLEIPDRPTTLNLRMRQSTVTRSHGGGKGAGRYDEAADRRGHSIDWGSKWRQRI